MVKFGLISTRKFKQAKKVLALFEVLGLTEDDLVSIKTLNSKIEALESKVDDLERFRTATLRVQQNETSGAMASMQENYGDVKELIKQMNTPGEDFYPDGKHPAK